MLAESNLRKNHTYRLINYGEETIFEVRDVLSLENYIIKNILSLELLEFQDLVCYGKSKDFLLEEFDQDL